MDNPKKINTRNSLLVCAFCKHWYDPASSHIRPYEHDPFMVWWEYEKGVKSICELRRRQTYSESICTHFDRKIPKK